MARARAWIAGALIGAILPMTAQAEACRDDRVSLRGPFGEASFRVELADDAAERAQGLMNREHLSANAGMLFVYDQPQPVTFWMRNTLIPLDLVFIDENGVVVNVHDNAVPLDESHIPSDADVTHVLEINGGMAAAIGLAEGAQLRHPSVHGPAPVWPCD